VGDADAGEPDADPTWDHVTSCPQGLGPTMVLLPSGFCIDSTEVTRAQYRAWLETSPSLEGQHERCQLWKDSFTPTDFCGEHPDIQCPDDDCPQHCVDWCDAYAFCKAAGKRLCGKTSGGVIDGWWTGYEELLTDANDANVSQWYNACSSGGLNQFPYGNDYDAEACNTVGPSSPAFPVASKASCQSTVSGYEGVYDVSGNLAEWEDNCIVRTYEEPGAPNDGSLDECATRGGSFASTGEDAACAVLTTDAVRAMGGGAGFRCCYP
jgi:formylglycine-generating enzyme required for sulfatase activity